MDRPVSNFQFIAMSFIFRLRDFILPRKNILEEVGIQPGFQILDYGCGPGSYIPAAAEMVGKSGKIYALDINPVAIQHVKTVTLKKQLENVETILSDLMTGLPDSTMDAVLLYDTFHKLSEPDRVLEELHRVLKPNGILSFSDHHMKKKEIISRVTKIGLFKLVGRGKRTYSFSKEIILKKLFC
jgi:ubiquinone/menaquinone biosynthesis C-methylase UbiE